MANVAELADHERTRGPTINVRPVKSPPARPLVYFVGAETGLIKIGSTKYLDNRLFSLRCGSPVTLTLLATVKGDRRVERKYHARFAALRSHGEWFERHPDILAEIARLNGATDD